MSRKLISQLREIKNENGRLNPDLSWVAQNRAKMMEDIRISTRIENEDSENKQGVLDSINEALNVFVSNKTLTFARSSLTVMLIGFVAVSGWIASVSASYNSLPGDALYGVKIAAEKTELIVAAVIGSEEDEVTTILKHASTRVDEYQRSESTDQATVAIKSLKEKIESTQESLDKVNQKSAVKAVAVAKVVEKKTEEILDSLTENDEAINKPAGEKDEDPELTKVQLKKELGEAEVLIQKAGIKAVEVLVEKVEKAEVGEDVITKDDVKETINRKLNKLAEGVSKLDGAVIATSEKASSTIATIKIVTSTKAIVDDTAVSTTEKIAGVMASSTEATMEESSDDTEEKVVNVVVKVEAAEQKIEETNKKTEETKVEVQTLIDQDNLIGALQKIIELDDAKSETKMAVDEASDAVEEAEKVIVNDLKEDSEFENEGAESGSDESETTEGGVEEVVDAVQQPLTN